MSTSTSSKSDGSVEGSAGVMRFDLSNVRGLKKTGAGMFSGITLKYEDPNEGGKMKEVKFGLVTKRDELFIKLVGWGSIQ